MAFKGVIDEVPSFGTTLARGLGSGLSQGFNQASGVGVELMKNKIQRDRMAQALVSQGIDPKDAELYSALTTGGQTEFAKQILENKKRGMNPFSSNPNEQVNELSPEESLEQYLQGQDSGLTPAERVRRGSERYKTGLPEFQEAGKKLRTFSDNKTRLDILDSLEKSNKLPSYLGRINVDSEGNLRLPFLASPEAQRFVKTINEFASGAKDTYGSRVTNFDLAQYLKQFPSLLNSKEGINQLVKQLRIVNDINSVYYKNLQNVYRKAGGVRNIDSDVAQSLAEQMSEKQVEKLTKKFSNIGSTSQLPAASKNKGKIYEDEETGERFVSNGRDWVKQ